MEKNVTLAGFSVWKTQARLSLDDNCICLGKGKERFFLRTEYETCVEDSAAALFRRKGKPSARGDGTISPQVLSVKEQEKARERVERQHAELLPQELLAWENGMWWG